MIEGWKTNHQTIQYGCGFFLLLAIVMSLLCGYRFLDSGQQAARYPGTTLVAHHNDYQGLPRYLLINQTYVTSDSLEAIHRWYATQFPLTMVAHDITENECYVLYQSQKQLMVQQDMGVLLVRHINRADHPGHTFDLAYTLTWRSQNRKGYEHRDPQSFTEGHREKLISVNHRIRLTCHSERSEESPTSRKRRKILHAFLVQNDKPVVY